MSDTPFHSSSSRDDLIDLGLRATLGLAFAFDAGICLNRALAQFRAADFGQLDARLLSHALAVLAIGLFTLMIACLYALQLRPVRTAPGIRPRAAAILGGFLMCGLLLLNQRTDLPLMAQVAASSLVLAGNGFAIYVLTHLGRSFSILPQSRKLVTSGPYQVVRHPLYLAEAVATVGAVIEFMSTWALILVIVQFSLQLIRINYEEIVLGETFPEYKTYSKQTWRLLPLIY